MRRLAAVPLTALLLVFAPAAAWAHGSESHAAKPAARGPAEQKDFGIAGDVKGATRTVRMDMSDAMRFAPAELQVRQGETVRFVVRNSGRVMHELVLGTPQELQKHAEMMRKFPDMEHDEPYMVHVAPGKTGELVWTFNRPGEFQYACLIPGHFEAGMVGRVRVVAATGSAPAAAATELARTGHRH